RPPTGEGCRSRRSRPAGSTPPPTTASASPTRTLCKPCSTGIGRAQPCDSPCGSPNTRSERLAMSVTPTPALDQVEQRALDVARATYEAVRRADVLDSRDHWDRFANRLQSAAYAPDGGEYLAQLARR